MDIGGTSLKSAVLSGECEVLLNSFSLTSINSRGSAEQIIATITSMLKKQSQEANNFGELKGIGLSIPGPFDYEKGISLMKHKFQNIYGLNLRSEITKMLALPERLPVIFEEDSAAFLKGEAWMGNAKGFNRIIGLTLGEGLGASFMVNGKITRDTSQGTPPDGELWHLPCEGGILEDKLSRRGIMQIYREITGSSEESDVKDIALRAESGDVSSIRTFEEFGLIMGQLLKPHVQRFNAECIVIGGQISKSFELFATPLSKVLSLTPSLKKVTRAKSVELSPLYGLLRYFLEMVGINYGFNKGLSHK
ncbi:MAG TPA: ROK family protein [Dehalococcoidia bacterium]|nr:ROK family protein [Dehalococcoidia bacterium]